MNSLPGGRLPLFEHADWARGQDIVIHNECWANVTLSPQAIRHITEAGVPRMFVHCALHSYRVMTDDGWRELIGADSRRHTRAHNMAVTWADDDPITNGLPPFVTPIDELYVIQRAWPGLEALATAASPEDGNPTFPVAWTYNYRGARVFGTTLGHGNETWHTNQFKDLIVRGFRWAIEREPVALPPPAPPARGGGAGGRGLGGVQ
jgi:type 1 glutamine amidotransferase